MNIRILWSLGAMVMLGMMSIVVGQVHAIGTGPVVIHHVYGGGGNSGAPYESDFIVLRNVSSASVDITNRQLQNTSAAGVFPTTNRNIILSGMIAPGAYYLVEVQTNNTNGIPLLNHRIPNLVIPAASFDSPTSQGFGVSGNKFRLLNNLNDIVDYLGTSGSPNSSHALVLSMVTTGGSTAPNITQNDRSLFRVNTLGTNLSDYIVQNNAINEFGCPTGFNRVCLYYMNTFTVQFVDYDGSVIDIQGILSGDSATAPTNPTRTGYTFSGWSTTFDTITSDLTITAEYTLNTYTVTFQDRDTTVISSGSVTYGSGATAPANPTRTGYTFSGWSTTFDTITSDLTITAEYTLNTYTVTFQDRDTTVISSGSVTYGSGATAPANPTRTGYTFSGWSTTFDTITSDLTITAEYTLNTYTVTFQDRDTTVISSGSVTYGSGATAPANPTRTGYTFSGWSTTFDTITSDLTITAEYTLNTYTVTFQDRDTTVISSGSVTYGSGATAPTNPTRTGYTFSGWSTTFDTITSDLTITAEYTLNTYTVTFQDRDTTVISSGSVTYGSGATAPANPTRTGYTFSGWSTTFDTITSDLTITAEYTLNTYTVTFQDRDTTVISSGSVTYGSGATAPANPTRIGYTFSGWSITFDTIMSDLTVTAEYTLNTYTVTFQDRDTTFISSGSVNYGSGATAPANPTRIGYTFSGWSITFDTIMSDLTVTAEYTLNTYTVTFQDRDTTFISSGSVNYGSGATAPANPTRIGYTFSGWSITFDTIMSDLTVTAEYTLNTYTVTFQDRDTTFISSGSVNYGSGATAPANPTRIGYTFSGWSTTFDTIMSDLTVTAEYTLNTYTVTFQDRDTTFISSGSVNYGSGATAPANPTRIGYTFSGWSTTFDTIMSDLTVTAEYTLNTYTVTFQDRDTTFISSGSVNYGSGATAPANPTRIGYTFSGWSTTFDTIMSDLTVTAEWIDINECMSQALNSCSINASCNNTIGSYTCNCNAGYIGDGITCTICPAGTKQTNNQCVACAENETSDAGSTLCTTVYTYGGPTVLTNGTPGQPLSEPTTIPGEESTLPNNTTNQNDTPSLPSSESISLSTKERIFNPGFTESCFDYIDKSTIDQGVVVSNTFKDAHQLFYSYALTKWQGTSDYRPFSSLTREEAARFFVEFARNVLCRVPNQIYSNQFSDINNADTTLIDFIKASYEYGIFQGDSARDLPVNQTRTFRPKALMTQDEIAAVIVRLVSNQNFDANSDDRASVYRTFLNRYAQSKLLSTKRDNIAEVMYDLYRWNEYNFSNIGYVIIQ